MKTMPNGTKTVAYQNLVGLLIEAIKEHQTQIQTLQNDLVSCCEKTKNLKSTNNTTGQTNTESKNSVQENSLPRGVVL